MDLEGGGGFVEGVEVDAADVVIEEVVDLFGRPVDADFFNAFGGRCPLNGAEEFGGDPGTGSEVGHPGHSGEGIDWHDPGDDGDVDAGEFATLAEVVEIAVIEEKLGDDVIGSGIDLGFEILNFFQAVRGGGMSFGEAGHSDGDVGEMFSEERNQIGGVEKTVRGWLPFGLTFGRIAAEGEDVAESGLMVALDDAADFVLGRADAGEVGDDGEVGLFLDADDELMGAVASGTSGSVGDGNVGGLKRHEILDILEEEIPIGIGFGRKELEAKGWVSLGKDIGNQHERMSSRDWPMSKSGNLRC